MSFVNGLMFVGACIGGFAWLFYSVARTERLWGRIESIAQHDPSAKAVFESLDWEQLWLLMFVGVPERWILGGWAAPDAVGESHVDESPAKGVLVQRRAQPPVA